MAALHYNLFGIRTSALSSVRDFQGTLFGVVECNSVNLKSTLILGGRRTFFCEMKS